MLLNTTQSGIKSSKNESEKDVNKIQWNEEIRKKNRYLSWLNTKQQKMNKQEM